jgi:hypothetical protein
LTHRSYLGYVGRSKHVSPAVVKESHENHYLASLRAAASFISSAADAALSHHCVSARAGNHPTCSGSEKLDGYDSMKYHMKSKNSRWIALALLCAVPFYAQTPKRTATLNGRVFAISVEGGLLPARMASGWVLSCNEIKVPDELYQDACNFFQASLHHRKQFCGTSATCITSAAMHSLEETLEWTRQHHTRVFAFTADEEGFFNLSHLPTATMLIFAYGQAGSEQCVWIRDGIAFKGVSQTVKLSSPFSGTR